MALNKEEARRLKRLEGLQKKTEQKIKWLRTVYRTAIDPKFVQRHFEENTTLLASIKSEISHLKNLQVR